jgi:hypothetical protein
MEAIERSRALLLIFSAHSNVSQHVVRELESAVAKDVPVIPLRIDATEPSKAVTYFITGAQWLQVPPRPSDMQIALLAEGIARRIGRPAAARAETAASARREASTSAARRILRLWTAGTSLAVLLVLAALGIFLARRHPSEDRPSPASRQPGVPIPAPASAPVVVVPAASPSSPAEPPATAPASSPGRVLGLHVSGTPSETAAMRPLVERFGGRGVAVLACVREKAACRASSGLAAALLNACGEAGLKSVDVSPDLTADQMAALFDRADFAAAQSAALRSGAGVVLAVLLDIDPALRGKLTRVFDRDMPAVDTRVRFAVAATSGPVVLSGGFNDVAGNKSEGQLAEHAVAVFVENYLVPTCPRIE